ncbi:MAG: metallophosphoesterase family protein [Bacteroidia bacterium]
MKKIVLLSDTHGYMDEHILKFSREADEIWHGGDWGPDVNEKLEELKKPIQGVYGNIDGQPIRAIYPEIKRFDCEGIKVFIKHIGGYPGHYSQGVKAVLANEKPGIFISGHSHILKVMRDETIPGMLHVNPGAAGVHGFHKVRTMINFKIDNGKVFDMNVIELGSRG